MIWHKNPRPLLRRGLMLLALALALAALVSNAAVVGQQSKNGLLRIGTSGILTTEKTGKEQPSRRPSRASRWDHAVGFMRPL